MPTPDHISPERKAVFVDPKEIPRYRLPRTNILPQFENVIVLGPWHPLYVLIHMRHCVNNFPMIKPEITSTYERLFRDQTLIPRSTNLQQNTI